ncbi:phosphatase PAP2 family protein [uncultured Sphingomonas sp.]|uniref:phosphatase PAP2 family protein n=1 Tax=uncultured Sphingomonas sp. TaxID=158754 RepID=UPI0025D74513|nr:phosphatase PAP2 family protein [uncultured Sphingomonas sp.]
MRLPKSNPFAATTSDSAAWWMLALMLATCLAAASGLGFRIDAWRAVPPAVGLALLGGAAWYGRRHERPRLAAGSIAFLQMTLFTLFGVVLAYALAARAGAMWDARLAAADRMLGFDWLAVFTTADRAPAALWIGGFAYHSLTLQMVTCIVAMSAYAQFDRLRIAIAAAILSGFVTILISWWVPAMGNVFDPARYTRLWPSIAWLEQAMIAGLRDGTWRVLDLTKLMGIVSFPSFHATLPVILSWAQRDTPVWRFVAPVWAGVTIIATPLFGGHYGVDVLGGLALAPLALVVAPWLVRRRGDARPGLARGRNLAQPIETRIEHGIG